MAKMLPGKGTPSAPAYRNVANSLAERIRSGELPPGCRVPPERELALEYGVSRMTARAAVKLLEQRGLIERRERAGTFVAAPKVELDLSAVAGLSTRLLRQGITPGARVIEAEAIPAVELRAGIRQALEITGQEGVYVVVRTRTGDGQPLALEESYFPARFCTGLLSEDLTGSIYELLRDRYGIEPANLSQKVEITQLDSSEAAKLGIRPDLPVLRVTRIARDASGRPMEFARDLYRGDRLVFVTETNQDGTSWFQSSDLASEE